MKKINTLTALIFILGTLRIFSQDIDTSNFFPYKTGDMWEYFFDAGGPDIDTVQTITVSDSTDQEGKIHITQISRHINPIHTVHLFNYIIDTVNNYVYGMSGVGTDKDLLFKLDGIQGDQWIEYKHEGDGFEMARIERVYTDTFLGINTTVKGFFYYATGDSTDTTGYARGYYFTNTGSTTYTKYASNQIASFYVLLFPAFWHKSYPFPHTFIKGKICYIFRQTVCLFRLYS